MLNSLFAALTSKLAAGGLAVALATTGGLAATGELPDKVQDKLSKVADKIGVQIPEGDDTEAIGEESGLEDIEEIIGEQEPKLDAGKRSNFDVHAAMETNTATVRGRVISEAARQKPGDTTNGGGSQSKSVSSDVHTAINSTDPGPERGKAVSEAASQNRQNGGSVDGPTGGTGDSLTDDSGSEEDDVTAGNARSHGQGHGQSKKNRP